MKLDILSFLILALLIYSGYDYAINTKRASSISTPAIISEK